MNEVKLFYGGRSLPSARNHVGEAKFSLPGKVEHLLPGMPVSKQAEKKLRHDKIRSIYNMKKKEYLQSAIKRFRKNPSRRSLPKIFQLLDKAKKTNLIHKNKADRLKSRLSKLLKP